MILGTPFTVIVENVVVVFRPKNKVLDRSVTVVMIDQLVLITVYVAVRGTGKLLLAVK